MRDISNVFLNLGTFAVPCELLQSPVPDDPPNDHGDKHQGYHKYEETNKYDQHEGQSGVIRISWRRGEGEGTELNTLGDALARHTHGC